MENNKAFTLIELLAIIVILAIIAVITVPIILNIIENSRMGAATDSAYGYKDAINKYYVSELSNNGQLQLDGDYIVTDGVLNGSGIENKTIPVSGTVPTSGTLTYEKSIFKSGCLVIGDYAVTFNADGTTSTEKGECSSTPTEPDYSAIVASLSGSVKTDGYKYLTTPQVVYYNPVTGQKCSDYSVSNSSFGYSTGCMKWYAYSVKDNVVNMILDHNINTTNDSLWVSSTDYSNSSTLGSTLGVSNMGNGSYGKYGNHDKGPLTVLNKLKTLTNSWITSVQGDYSTYTAAISNAAYSIDYAGYSARLLTAQEVAYIVGNDSWDEKTATRTGNFWFGSKDKISPSSMSEEQRTVHRSYMWLLDNIYHCSGYGCENNSSIYSGNWGYWLSSPTLEPDRSDFAWCVYQDGQLYTNTLDSSKFGVRPVINVSTSEVFS